MEPRMEPSVQSGGSTSRRTAGIATRASRLNAHVRREAARLGPPPVAPGDPSAARLEVVVGDVTSNLASERRALQVGVAEVQVGNDARLFDVPFSPRGSVDTCGLVGRRAPRPASALDRERLDLGRPVTYAETRASHAGPSSRHCGPRTYYQSLLEPDSQPSSSSTSSSVAPENVRHTVALIRECPRIGEGTPAIAFALFDRERRTAGFWKVH